MAHSIVTDFDSTLPCTETTILFKKPCQNMYQTNSNIAINVFNELIFSGKSGA